ncbi:MAG: transaldolase [Verrucomicrobiota bacterium]
MKNLKIKIYADGADKEGMLKLYLDPLIQGLTTNPTLMRKAGISEYETFARNILEIIQDKPISFEVFSDDFDEMKKQALKIKSWQENVYVKIPVTNSLGESSSSLIGELAKEGVQLNITAILTLDQIREVNTALNPEVASVISVFAGRISDTGIDPEPLMKESKKITKSEQPKAELLWASVREVYNIYQADRCGCDIVTVPHNILSKAIKMSGKDNLQLSLETVQMFKEDAEAAGFQINC